MKRLICLLVLVGDLAAASEKAPPVTGLAWDWEAGEQHRYVIQNRVDLSTTFWMRDELNREGQVSGWTSELNVLCTGGGPVSKRTFAVTCHIDDLRLVAFGNDSRDAEVLPEVVSLWDDYLTGSDVELVFRDDGQLKTFDVEVETKLSNDRTRLMTQEMRLLLERAFAGFEVSMPKKGEPGSGPWSGKPPRLIAVPTLQGSMGNPAIVSAVTAHEGDLVTVRTQAKGVRAPAEENSQGVAINTWAFEGVSSWTLNTQAGVLTQAEHLINGTLTPSSQLAMNSTPSPYIQALRIELRAPGATVEPFGENEVHSVRP